MGDVMMISAELTLEISSKKGSSNRGWSRISGASYKLLALKQVEFVKKTLFKYFLKKF